MPHETEIAASLAIVEAELMRLEVLLAGSEDRHILKISTARDHLAKAVAELGEMLAGTGASASEPAPVPAAEPATLADRMIPPGIRTEAFRTRVTIKAIVRPLPPEPPPAVAVNAEPLNDDLTRIRGIDQDLRDRLYAIGITTFAGLAAMTGDDVRRVGAQLGLGRQISRQNWIEQAELLSRLPAAPVALDVSSVAVIPVAPEVMARVELQVAPEATAPIADPSAAIVAPVAVTQTMALSMAPAVEAPDPAADLVVTDRLDLIRGIDAHALNYLHKSGITRWSDIANWRRADIERVEAGLGTVGTITSQNWIEQAALLAATGGSAHANSRIRGLIDLVAGGEADPSRASAPLLECRALAPADTADAGPAPEDRLQPPIEFVETVAVEPPPAGEAAVTLDAGLAALPPGPSIEIVAPLVPVDPAPVMVIEGLDAIEFELTAMIANDASPVAMPVEDFFASEAPDGTTLTGASRETAAKVTANIEDEEFTELLVEEAEVMILQRRPASAAPDPVPPLAYRTRSLLSRLTRAAPLDDIDPGNYAAYRERIEEATVEIVKRGHREETARKP